MPPHCSPIWGARVIKIESPPAGDPYRYFAPDPVYSFNFAHLNRNKESVWCLISSLPRHRAGLDLLKRADVFVENFRPGRQIASPRLRNAERNSFKGGLCSISAFGQSGPYAEKPGFDTLGRP